MKFDKKRLEFPEETKEQFERYLSRKTLEITYYDGYMINFGNANISAISPYKVIMKSRTKELVILYYGDYMYDENLYFINTTKNACTFARLRELVRNYF